jgi:peptidoglycan/LPS O-acetylase OafA/YrhL
MALRPPADGMCKPDHGTRDRTVSIRDGGDGIAGNIDTVRGLACLLIVALHVVGDTASNGLHLPMTSDWHYAMESIEFLRIPLFTALSGYLYAGQRVTVQDLGRFWTKKLRRLAVPLGFATVVYWWLHGHAHTDTTPLPHALLFEYGHLWYLQALLILFAGISIADALFRPRHVTLVLTGLTSVMISQAGLTVTTFFGVAGAFYLAPYFLFGLILREHPAWLRDRQSGVLALGIVVIVLTSQQFGLFGITNGVAALQLPAAVAGMAGVVFLLQRLPANALLANVGRYSYTIYLWHVLAGAAVRDGLVRVGVTAIPPLFLCSLAAGIGVPIMLYHVARRIPLLSVAATGERWIGGGGRSRQMVVAAVAP